jgi:hypothetical protein
MCPFCIATMGLVVAGAVSTGGLAALAVKISQKETEKQKSFRPQKKGASSREQSIIRKSCRKMNGLRPDAGRKEDNTDDDTQDWDT